MTQPGESCAAGAAYCAATGRHVRDTATGYASAAYGGACAAGSVRTMDFRLGDTYQVADLLNKGEPVRALFVAC